MLQLNPLLWCYVVVYRGNVHIANGNEWFLFRVDLKLVIHCWWNMEDSLVEITEQEAIDTVEELWSRLFSVETRIDIDNFYRDWGMKRTLEDPNDRNPTKSSRNG